MDNFSLTNTEWTDTSLKDAHNLDKKNYCCALIFLLEKEQIEK